MGEKSCLYGKTTSMLDKGTRFLIASLPRNLKIYLQLLFRLLGNFIAGKISCSCSRSWNESPSFVLFLTFIFRQQFLTYYHVCLLIFMHSKIYISNLIFVLHCSAYLCVSNSILILLDFAHLCQVKKTFCSKCWEMFS